MARSVGFLHTRHGRLHGSAFRSDPESEGPCVSRSAYWPRNSVRSPQTLRQVHHLTFYLLAHRCSLLATILHRQHRFGSKQAVFSCASFAPPSYGPSTL